MRATTIARRIAATGLAAAALTAGLGAGVADAAPQRSSCVIVKSATTTVTFQGKSATKKLENLITCQAQFAPEGTREFTNHANLQVSTNPSSFVMSTPALVLSDVASNGSFHVDIKGVLRTGATTATNTSTITKTHRIGADVGPTGDYVLEEIVTDAAGHVADTVVTFKTATQVVG